MDLDEITKPLKVLEKLDISDEYERRLAFKAIYDVVMRSMLFLCTEYYGWRKEVLLSQGLNSRWSYIETALKLSNVCTKDELSEWKKFVRDINKTRNKVEHNDSYSPSQKELENYRKKLPEFFEWIISASKRYLENSSEFTFKMAFYSILAEYIHRAEFFQNYFGEAPYLIKIDLILEEKYEQLSDLITSGKDILKKIRERKDLERNDLMVLTELIELVDRIDMAENVCLRENTCPKCGGEIAEEDRYIGGSIDDPEPYAVVYRVGCKNCEYTLHEESFLI